MPADLRIGSYLDVLSAETWDALICDPPYSARTHKGHNEGNATMRRSVDRGRDALRRMEERVARGEPASASGRARKGGRDALAEMRAKQRHAERQGTMKRAIKYAAWSEADCRAFVEWAAPRTRGWMVILCDHHQHHWYADAMTKAGRYAFAPVVWYAPGSRVRISGDGPSCWCCWIAVSRPRRGPCVTWGSLPGGYEMAQTKGVASTHIGGKPIALMRDLVDDYSRVGDVVCDPVAGYGTTLRAALARGRHALGSEVDQATYQIAVDLLAGKVQPREDDPQRALF